MLLSLLAFIISAVALFLSSQALLSRLYRLVKNINLIFFLLLPGIFLHEFSHILSAELLQVKTGALNLRPSLKDGHLQLGSAQIAQTDPFRLTLIGLAPFISGSISLWLLFKFGIHFTNYLLPITYYLIFAIANTMFSSPADLQTAGLPVIFIFLLSGLLHFSGLAIPVNLINSIIGLFHLCSLVFLLVICLNLFFLILLKLIALIW